MLDLSLTCVYPIMSFKIVETYKCFVTLVTFERFLTSMSEHVTRQFCLSFECFITVILRARKRLFILMNTSMHPVKLLNLIIITITTTINIVIIISNHYHHYHKTNPAPSSLLPQPSSSSLSAP